MVENHVRNTAPRPPRHRKRLLAASAAVIGALLLSSCWSANQGKDLGYINQYRRANNRAALNGNSALMQRAQAWAQHMANTGVLEHSGGPGRVSTSGIANWCGVAENVGYASSTLAVHQAFVASPGHRANMIGNYDRVGTGVVRVGSTVWVAEVYVRSC
ncbi:MAG: CAP domain-containing protein [Aquihabitans sp.]